ncbi:hypothetical protein ACQY0O_000078 [Thecaphora frezii]
MYNLSKTLLLCLFAVQAALCAPTHSKHSKHFTEKVFLIVPNEQTASDSAPATYETLATCFQADPDLFYKFSPICKVKDHSQDFTAACAVATDDRHHTRKRFKDACLAAGGGNHRDLFHHAVKVQLWDTPDGLPRLVAACNTTIVPARIYPAFFYERNACMSYLTVEDKKGSTVRCRVRDADEATLETFWEGCEAASKSATESASAAGTKASHAVA